MSNVRISEIANELGYPSKEIVEKAQELGLALKRLKQYMNTFKLA